MSAFTSACVSDNGQDPHSHQATIGQSNETIDQNAHDAQVLNTTPIPDVGVPPGACDADADRTPLALCDWTMSLDGLAIGYVTAVELMRSPAEIGVSGGDPIEVSAEECEGWIAPGLKVTLEVKASLGPVPQDSVDIYMGRGQFLGWMSAPVDHPEGEVIWRESPRTTTPGAKIDVGQHLGFPIHFHEESQVWSLMGERIFTVHDDESISFQGGTGYCGHEIYPSLLNGVKIDDLVSQANACTTQSQRSLSRKSALMHNFGRYKAKYMSAICVIRRDLTAEPEDLLEDPDEVDE